MKNDPSDILGAPQDGDNIVVRKDWQLITGFSVFGLVKATPGI
jgi:hypothetical protein